MADSDILEYLELIPINPFPPEHNDHYFADILDAFSCMKSFLVSQLDLTVSQVMAWH